MRRSLTLLVYAVVLLMGCAIKAEVKSKPENLLVDGIKKPTNLHQLLPRLSWHVPVAVQKAFHIQVASSLSLLRDNQADLWDSQKVASSQSQYVPYEGIPLLSEQRAYWRVKIWDDTDNSSGWSQASSWTMGLLSPSDWQAKWIQVDKPVTSAVDESLANWINFAANPDKKIDERKKFILNKLKKQQGASYFRYQFDVNKSLVSATLHSTAAGYYEIFVNGQRVDDRIMDPGQTDYDQRILYNSDDVKQWLLNGDNTIAVHLGSGWYNEDIAFSKEGKSLAYGQPSFIAQLSLVYSDGSTELVTTNEDWVSHPSPVLKEGLFSGEYFDATQQLSYWNINTSADLLTDWLPVKVKASWPTKTLEPQLLPAIKAVKEIKPVAIFNPKPDVWVYDFGQNFTGVPTVNISSLGLNDGQTVYLRFAEWADTHGNISQKSGGGAPQLKQVDAYRANSNAEGQWTPTFTWHGFRYIEVTGLDNRPQLDAITAHLVRSDVEVVGQFISSDELLNRIHDMALWSYETNLISVPMDCPIRERAGWTGDAHAALITGNYNYGMDAFWKKYLGDFKTSRHVAPAIVPGRRSHGGNFDWAAAEVIIAWEHYRHHGDVQLLQKQYDSLEEYMTAAERKLSKSLLRTGYGDWCDPVRKAGMSRVGGRCNPQQTPAIKTTSAFYAHTADLMASISEILGKQDKQTHYKRLFERVSQQYHKEFYNSETSSYGSQTADAIALKFNMVPARLRESVAAAINKDVIENWHGHASVGALGQTYLYTALSDFGYGDTAFNIFKAQGYPGYSYLLDTLKATTLWERKGGFNPDADPTGKTAPGRSLNHPFHSGYDGWFYEGLGGIRLMKNSVGFQEFELKPVFVNDLEFANVSYKTGYGLISSQWRRSDDKITWEFTVPNNTSAWVVLPNNDREKYNAGTYSLTVSE